MNPNNDTVYRPQCLQTTLCWDTMPAHPLRGFVAPRRRTGLRELAALKQRLRAHLNWVSQREHSLEEKLRPQSIKDIDMLRGKLNEALAELDRRRKELANRRNPPRHKPRKPGNPKEGA
jgi:hypothetical protein